MTVLVGFEGCWQQKDCLVWGAAAVKQDGRLLNQVTGSSHPWSNDRFEQLVFEKHLVQVEPPVIVPDSIKWVACFRHHTPLLDIVMWKDPKVLRTNTGVLVTFDSWEEWVSFGSSLIDHILKYVRATSENQEELLTSCLHIDPRHALAHAHAVTFADMDESRFLEALLGAQGFKDFQDGLAWLKLQETETG